jgi:hypothetical protein
MKHGDVIAGMKGKRPIQCGFCNGYAKTFLWGINGEKAIK